MRKRMQSIFLVVMLVAGMLIPDSTVQASEDFRPDIMVQTENVSRLEVNPEINVADKCGLKPMQVIEVTGEEMSVAKEVLSGDIESEITEEERAYWSQFSGTYYYDLLNEQEKAFWDNMEDACIKLATSSEDYTGNELWVECDSSISVERMLDVMWMFNYNNPQYFFVNNWMSYGGGAGSLGVYDAFYDGETRAAATADFTAKIDGWLEQIKAVSRPEEKVKLAHDLVCANTDYASNEYDQSAYSMVCVGETVCAGYTKTLNMLGNAAGVETISVTSSNHAWNVVKLHDIWYEVDATWDDQSYGTIYWFYNKSRNTFLANDSQNSHVEEATYASILVDAPYDMSVETYSHISPYFTENGNTYFVVNDNANLAELMVKRIEGSGTLPEKVVYNSKEYNVIGASESTPTPTPVVTPTPTPVVTPTPTPEVTPTPTPEVTPTPTPVVTPTPTPVVTPTPTPIPTGTPPEPEPEEQLNSFVERMYTVALGRAGEQEGIEYWVERLLNGENDGAGIAHGFLQSPEFINKNLADNDYIRVLYATFFDRIPAGDEIAYWGGALASGESREFVLAGFVNSNEFDGLCAGYGISRGFMREDGSGINPGIIRFTERLYTKALERDGEKEGIEYWALRIADGVATPEAAAKSFFLSPEYVNRNTSDEQYIKALYRTFMDREAEADGVTYWQGVMDDGATREAVLTGFAQSPEFQKIMASYGL